jgi:nucleoside-diphosphate-sugar epimerase
MKNILVIGSTGQIGSELTMLLRHSHPEGTVVAGYIPGAEPKGELLESGPAEVADVRNGQ